MAILDIHFDERANTKVEALNSLTLKVKEMISLLN